MLFRLANKGEYYLENPSVSEEIKIGTPKEVGLVYWDYYNEDETYIENMMKTHLTFDNEVWVAGGAWTWIGFASGNKKVLETMFPAMEAAKKCKIENIFLTMWGDNGKETSFYSVLPSLYAVRRYYDGARDIDKIKREFKELTGEDYNKKETKVLIYELKYIMSCGKNYFLKMSNFYMVLVIFHYCRLFVSMIK